jgi:hypothetical protein
LYNNETHLQFLQEFLGLLPPNSTILDAATGAGRYLPYLLEKKPQMHRMEENYGLADQGPSTRFAPLVLKAADVVRLLHGKVVKAPSVFSKILTNRFEVTELSLIELPIYIFRYKYLGREGEIRIHGVTGRG